MTTDDPTPQEVLDGLYRAVQIDNRPPPPLLYHYTNARGLLGIVESGGFWATDLLYLNDSTEYKYGVRTLAETVQKTILERAKLNAPGRRGLTEALPVSQQLNFSRIVDNTAAVAKRTLILGVACFCENGDLLSQWRGYSEASSGGYSIGFRTDELRPLLESLALPLYPVVYDAKRHLDHISASLDAQIAHRAFDGSAEWWQVLLDLAGASAVWFMGFAAQLKDPAFREEQEWRLGDALLLGHDSINFRPGGLGVVPYLELKLAEGGAKLPIGEVIVSPGPEADLRADAMRTYFRQKGYDLSGMEFKTSKIPYRTT